MATVVPTCVVRTTEVGICDCGSRDLEVEFEIEVSEEGAVRDASVMLLGVAAHAVLIRCLACGQTEPLPART